MDPDRYASLAYGLPSINSTDDLTLFLKGDIGYCGCAHADDAFALLRDTLRIAAKSQRAICDSPAGPDHDASVAAYRELQDRLQFAIAPGLATWFLYMLAHHELIAHGSNVTTCWITPKGAYVLEAIECFAPDSARHDHDPA